MTKLPHALPLQAAVPPLRLDEGEVVRIGNTRISLDLLVEQYENGMTAEDLARAYDCLELADVHAAISYYLRHRAEVQAYLTQRKREAERVQANIEAQRGRVSKDDLLARRTENADASSGE